MKWINSPFKELPPLGMEHQENANYYSTEHARGDQKEVNGSTKSENAKDENSIQIVPQSKQTEYTTCLPASIVVHESSLHVAAANTNTRKLNKKLRWQFLSSNSRCVKLAPSLGNDLGVP